MDRETAAKTILNYEVRIVISVCSVSNDIEFFFMTAEELVVMNFVDVHRTNEWFFC